MCCKYLHISLWRRKHTHYNTSGFIFSLVFGVLAHIRHKHTHAPFSHTENHTNQVDPLSCNFWNLHVIIDDWLLSWSGHGTTDCFICVFSGVQWWRVHRRFWCSEQYGLPLSVPKEFWLCVPDWGGAWVLAPSSVRPSVWCGRPSWYQLPIWPCYGKSDTHICLVGTYGK